MAEPGLSSMPLIHQRFTAVAGRHPERVALEFEDQQLSYAELDRQSSALAAGLQSLGVKTGDRVALHLDKSISAVVSILGILKSGACYVPIDPRVPLKRAEVILADCQVRVVIGTRAKSLRVVEHLPADSPLSCLIAVDAAQNNCTGALRLVGWEDALASDSVFREPVQNEEEPAYILYTSGSTGTPKGVMIAHRAALSFIDWASYTFLPTPDDRVISQAPFHFDLSVFDLFVTFQAGATLVLPPPGISILPADYARFLTKAKISLLYATPALLSSLLRHGQIDQLDWESLRLLLFAGDVMPPSVLREWMKVNPKMRCCNLYGPTETNVCTWFEVQALPEDESPIPIGIACGDLELLVVDPNGQPIADDQPGELWVSGANLMSGYWNRPEQNAESLVSAPSQVGKIYYRTSDQVRRAPDGNLLFLGRFDNMIKTRGYRVEPEEIERLLLQHPKISEALVVPVEDADAGTLLKAVAAASCPAPTVRELQRFCAAQLPDYMIPQRIEFVGELPKTSSGKLDRKCIKQNWKPTEKTL